MGETEIVFDALVAIFTVAAPVALVLPKARASIAKLWLLWTSASVALAGIIFIAVLNIDQKPENAALPSIGNYVTVIGKVPPENLGTGSTVVGATDASGNTILNKGGTAIGYCSESGATSVSIGAYAGSGGNCPSKR